MALIPPVTAATVAPIQPTTVAPTGADSAAASSRSDTFGAAVNRALDTLNTQQLNADQMARDAATGKLQNVEDYLLAASEAQLSTQLTVAVRNRAVEAFNEIMRMQV
jgi:flagellar hook-basal body complex protein FliE